MDNNTTWFRIAAELGQLRATAMATYERMCELGTRASSAGSWQAIAGQLVDVGAKMPCVSTARQMFDRADDAIARAGRRALMTP